ncbi:MAG: xanthine dehydrogenase family protein molybdopterin-binding subunit [bacterium]|nr:xanthine dehydrogenase family protein molybdopterin-binding subunit [bacterium]
MSGRKIVKQRYFFEDELIETVSEVPTGTSGAWKPEDKLKVVGKPISRIDGYDKVSGSAKYTFDIALPHMAFAATLRSPHPHARIKSIDTSKALKLPGVLHIITHENVPKIPWYGGSTSLFDTHLRYIGDEVACVAAESQDIAEEALRLIDVQYEKLRWVVDAEKAMKPNAPKLYDDGNNLNNGKPDKYERGDVEKGLAEADEVVEDTFTTQVAIHNPAEAHGSVVNWDGDKLTVWDSTQGVFRVRDMVAAALKIPASKVRVIKKYMGGGFGSKLEAGKYTVMAALLAKKTGRPVKIALNRREMNLSVGNRPESMQKLKVGVKKDGTMTALSHYFVGGTGAHARGAGCSWPLRTLYQCDNVETEEYSVLINAGRNRAFRAPGHVQGTFGLESLMDMAAEKLGMDPIELRKKNNAEKDQVFNLMYTSKRLHDAYDKGAIAIGWGNRRKPGSDKGPVKRGMGMASQIWWGGGGPPAYATLKLNRDGSTQVMAGTQDIGTGTYTFIAQIIAEVLETPIEKVSVVIGDTAVTPYCPLSGGSMTAPSVSPAIHDAAVQMKAKVISGAAAVMELKEDDLSYADGVVTSKSDPSKKMPLSRLFRQMRESVLVTTGARNANPKGYITNTFGAQFADVEVDTFTGKVVVKRIVAAHDVGRVLNPKLLENQIYGGVTQGLGFALVEERIIDRNTGRMVNPNFHEYKIPTIRDIPDIEMIIVSEADTKISAVGAKGVGEPAIIPTAAAVANAVYNAIGVRIKSLPITPDKVLNALREG